MTYPIMEHFYTLQGEGSYAGYAAYFIRLAGCDVGCHWCDVKESWDKNEHRSFDLDTILSWIPNECNRVIITGGEPAMYPLEPLLNVLKQKNLKVHIETSGAYNFNAHFDWVCVSPKKFKPPTLLCLSKADELKIIVFNKSDFDWAKKYESQVAPSCILYLQVEWSVRDTMYNEVIEFVKTNPQWQLSMQTHKYLEIP